MNKTIGILGGMGPEATVYLFNLIVNMTPAEKDQEHIPIIIFNNPTIPDRTNAIINEGPSPLPDLINSAKLLEKTGVDFILIPCITAHYFFEEIEKHISVPILHLLKQSLIFVQQELSDVKKIGLLATDGTIQTGMFHQLFHKSGIEIITPNNKSQNLLMNALYHKEGLKAGFKDLPKKQILKVLKQLLKEDIDAVMAGCTEIPLVLSQSNMNLPFINPLQIIAHESLRRAGYNPPAIRVVKKVKTSRIYS